MCFTHCKLIWNVLNVTERNALITIQVFIKEIEEKHSVKPLIP